jgi:hypothetical protein
VAREARHPFKKISQNYITPGVLQNFSKNKKNAKIKE